MKKNERSKKSWIKWFILMGASLFLVNPFSIWAQQATDPALVNQLMLKLQERDQVIADLQRRVQQLEQHVGGVQQDSESAVAAQPPAEPSTKAVADQPVQQTQTDDAAAPESAVAAQSPIEPSTEAAVDETVRQAQVNEAATETSSAAAAQNKAEPGSFEVDEEAAERALERTLVQTGALLLPFGQAEIMPFVNYAHFETEQSVLLRDSANNIAAVSSIENRRNDIRAGVFSRLGLPFETQAELSIPARVINQSNVVRFANRETDDTTYMLGDISVGLAKTLLRESAWLPDIVGRITWDTATGKQVPNDPSSSGLNTSFNELIFSATALKRQDPLAFTSTFSYRKTFKRDGIQPGDAYSLALGATLAASPQTSLSLGIQQSFIGNTKILNNSIPGSDSINSTFTFGASSIIGRRLFFSTNAGIGLTKNAPDYFINVAIPFRFNVPYQKMFKAN